MKAIVTNFAYGYGPLFRMVDLAKLIRSALDNKSYHKWYVIVPLAYPSFQVQALKNKYGSDDRILLDPKLGKILRNLFFEGRSYSTYLNSFAKSYDQARRGIQSLFENQFKLKNLRGDEVVVEPSSIEIEVAHNPRVPLPVSKRYYTSIALFSDILLRSRTARLLNVAAPIFSRCVDIALELEQRYDLRFIPEPSTFSHLEFPYERPGVLSTPPLIQIERSSNEQELHDDIIYLYLSGISETSALPRFALKNTPYHLYCSRKGFSNKGFRYADPSIIFNAKVKAVVSRAGWSTIWSCMLASKAFLALPFRRGDDPEMFFNLKTLVALKLGLIMRSGFSETVLHRSQSLIRNQREMVDRLLSLYGTADGLQYVADKIGHNYQSREHTQNER